MDIFNKLGNLINGIFNGITGLGIGIFGLMGIIMILGVVIGPQHQKENFKSAFVVFLVLFVVFILIKSILLYVQGTAVAS